MRARAVLAGLALAAGSALFAAPAAQASTDSSPAQFCQTSGIIGSLFDETAFFANQGGCASSVAQGFLTSGTITHAGYVSRCHQIADALGGYPFTSPEGEFVNIQNLQQCTDRLQQLHDEVAGG